MKRVISVIIACYRDEEAIPSLHERLTRTLGAIGVDYELIFVNDGSPDGTEALLERLCASDPRTRAIVHSRNFGSQNAFRSGMLAATGDACVLMDGDLQDPPELIEEFHRKWLEGSDIVYGVRARREMPAPIGLAYKLFYRIWARLLERPLPLDAGEFSLIDRRAMNAMNAVEEDFPLVRELRAWIGFKQIGVTYARPRRPFGRSTNSWVANFRWARRAIVSSSYKPLRALWLSFAVFVALAALGSGASLTVGIALLLLGQALLGEYLKRVSIESARRPRFIVARRIGFSSPPKAG